VTWSRSKAQEAIGFANGILKGPAHAIFVERARAIQKDGCLSAGLVQFVDNPPCFDQLAAWVF
jgi:hypothetical protein